MKKTVALLLMLTLLFLTVSCGVQAGEKGMPETDRQTSSTDSGEELVVCVNSLTSLQQMALETKVRENTSIKCKNIVFECVPDEGADREAYCQRVRVELMTGGGPDLFILSNDTVSDNVFSDVEKIMHGGHFLPLDSYIENWETDLFEKQTKVIMDAGKTEEGQVVLPLTYRLPVYVVYENETIEKEGPFKTWEALQTAAEKDETVATILSEQKSHWLAERLGKIGDYSDEKIVLTEDELHTVLEQVKNVEEKESPWDAVLNAAASGEIVSTAGDDANHMDLLCGMPFGRGIHELAQNEGRSALVIYNTDGGLTAQITSYAAVNRNTQHPEDAVKIAAMLYNTEFQTVISAENPSTHLTENLDSAAVPTSSDYTHFELLKPYLEEVNAVRFCSEFNSILFFIPSYVKEQDTKKLAEDTLQKMKMIMAE